MKRFKTVLIVLLGLLLASCSDTLLNSINLVAQDPNNNPPTVLSGRESGKIFIQWNVDIGADEYRLLRKDSLVGPVSTVYQGPDTAFTDATIVNDTSAFYALQKRKGKKWFSPSEFNMGFASDKLADSFEPNETQNTAVPFEIYQLSTLSIYANSGKVLSDVDYFYVDVGPRQKYQIVLAEIPTYPNNLQLSYKIGYLDPVQVILSKVLEIDNATVHPGRFYFAISLDSSLLNLSIPYGKSVSYSLTFDKITSLGNL